MAKIYRDQFQTKQEYKAALAKQKTEPSYILLAGQGSTSAPIYRDQFSNRQDYKAGLAAQQQGVDYSKVNPILTPEQVSSATHSWGGGFLSNEQLQTYLASGQHVPMNKVTDLDLPRVDNGTTTTTGGGTTGAAGGYVTGGGITTTGGATTGGTTTGGTTVEDVGTDILGQQEADINASIAAAQKSREDRVVSEMEIQRKLVDQMFTPQYSALDKELEKTLQSVQFSGAAPGSLWGDRQMAAVEGVHATAANNRRAIDAEKEATMRLYEAAIKGETDEVINSLKQNLIGVQGEKQKAADAMKLALAGADEASIKAAADLAKFNREAIQKFYEDQGMTYNPVTGETALNEQYQAEVQKMLSDKALTDVKAAEALDAIMNPKQDVEYITDETGVVWASWSNPKTKEMEVIDTGIRAPLKKTGGGGDESFGVDPVLGFNPALADEYSYYKNLLGTDVEMANEYIRGKNVNFATEADNWQKASIAIEAKQGGVPLWISNTLPSVPSTPVWKMSETEKMKQEIEKRKSQVPTY